MGEREKIAQIIAEHLCPQGKAHKTLYGAERMCYSRNNFADCEKVSECVDALIAAGIGNIRDTEHRDEVAERQAILLSKWLAEKTRKDYPWRAWFDAAQKQAERELAEEGKDG